MWDGDLVSPGIGFELHKPAFRFPLRFQVSASVFQASLRGLLSRTQLCRSLDDVLDVNEQWRFGYAWVPGGRDRWLP